MVMARAAVIMRLRVGERMEEISKGIIGSKERVKSVLKQE